MQSIRTLRTDAFNTATFKRLYGIIELNVRNGSHPDAANEIAPVRELTGPGVIEAHALNRTAQAGGVR